MDNAKNPVTKSDALPHRLRVMVVDYDVTCLMDLGKQLELCSYEVTTVKSASLAVSIIRARRKQFHLIMADINMPDMNASTFLKLIGMDLNVQVILMSTENDVSVARKALEDGACFFLVKPISIEILRNIWQHVFRAHRTWEIDMIYNVAGMEPENLSHESLDTEGNMNPGISMETTDEEDGNEENDSRDGIQKEEDSQREKLDKEGCKTKDDTATSKRKKVRMIWNDRLHQNFVKAVTDLDLKSCTPKNIIKKLDIPGVTRQQVASHLQKYRMSKKEPQDVSQYPKTSVYLSPKTKFDQLKSQYATESYYGSSGFRRQRNTRLSQRSHVNNIQSCNGISQNKLLSNMNRGSSRLQGFDGSNFGQPAMMNQHGIMNQVWGGARQTFGNSSNLGMVPNHNRMGASSYNKWTGIGSSTDTTHMVHQKSQLGPQQLGSTPIGGNFNTLSHQNHQDFTRMIQPENVGGFRQPPQLNYTKNYTGIQMTSNGGLINLNHNMQSEIREGSMDLGLDKSSLSIPILTQLNNNMLNHNMSSENREERWDFGSERNALQIPILVNIGQELTPPTDSQNLNQLPEYIDIVQEPDGLGVIGNGANTGNLGGFTDPMEGFEAGNLSQILDQIDFEELFSEQPLAGAELLDTDICDYQVIK